MSDTSLHPSLRRLAAKHRSLLRLLSMLLFLSMSGTMIVIVIIAFSSGDLRDLLLMGIVGFLMLPTVLLLSWLMRRLDRWLSRQLEQASELLREDRPLSARLMPMGLSNRAGTLVTVHSLTGQSATAQPCHALINPSFRWSPPPVGEVTVQLYCRDLQPGAGWVALQSDGKPLLGKMVELAAYYRQIRLWAIASLALLSIVAVVVGTLGVGEYRDYRLFELDARFAVASGDWPQVSAKVSSAELGTAQIPKGKIWTIGYWPRIKFEYFAAGAERRSDVLYFCNRPTENRQAAEAWLARYPTGMAVTARYDPTDPARAVLEAGYVLACESALAEKRLAATVFAAITGLLLLLALAVLGQFRRYRQVIIAAPSI